MKKIIWGIMGLGNIADKFAEALNSVDNTSFVCASRSMTKAEAFAEKYKALRFYGSYEQLVCDDEVDIVYIATPMSCHYDNVKLCLENNKNVLCEKSVTINAAQWEELIEIAAKKRLFLMEAMWMKCIPSFRKAKEWIAKGRIGKPTAVKAELSSDCVYSDEHRVYNKSLGGGALLDLGVYTITFACDILGYRPDETISAIKMNHLGTDAADAVLLKYSDRSFAELKSSFCYSSDNRAFILGTEGKIAFGTWFQCSRYAELYDKAGKLIERFDGEFICNGYEYEILEAQECLLHGKTDSEVIRQRDTLSVMRIMDEIRKQNGFVYDGEPYENK